MPTFGVHYDFNKKAFQGANGRFVSKSNGVFDRAVKHGARRGAAASRAIVPDRTGRLKGSIRGSGRGGAVRIWSDSPYAAVVEMGDGRRKIGPAKMTFYWEKKGRMFKYGGSDTGKFDKRNWPATVTRPRRKANPYLRPGLKVAEQEIIAYMKRHL